MLAEDAAPTGRLTADDHAGCHCQAAFQPQCRLRLGVVSAASRHLQLALQLRRGLGRRPSYYKAVLLRLHRCNPTKEAVYLPIE
jgi:hypothetical protein